MVRLESGAFDDDDVVRVSKSLAEFSATFTALVDACFGSDWAENPEILAMLRLRAARPPSSRRCAAGRCSRAGPGLAEGDGRQEGSAAARSLAMITADSWKDMG